VPPVSTQSASTPPEPGLPEFPAVTQLALAYAPAAARAEWETLLALDLRLAGIVRGAREPMLAQIRLAWWRDRLGEDPAKWPRGEPLLARLAGWGPALPGLAQLADGWEALLGAAPRDEAARVVFAGARAAALAGLAVRLGGGGDAQVVLRMARGWALGDLAARLSEPVERGRALKLAGEHDWRGGKLVRGMRPLVVLHALAKREVAGDTGALGRMLVAMRAGMFGF